MTAEETWVERVVAWRASGVSAAEYCKDKEYDVSALRTWSSRLGRAGKVPRLPVGRRPRKSANRSKSPPSGFARVVTKAGPAQLGSAINAREPECALVVVVGRARLEVAAGFDPELLRSVVAALAGGIS
jgi:hypothetical protein